MAKSCDPAARGATYNTLFLAIDNGAVDIEIRWTWDGTSVFPDCDGPLVDSGSGASKWAVQAVNNSAVTYYAHTTRANGQPATYTLNPGQTASVTANQASHNGYSLISDFDDLTLTTTA